MQVQIRELGGGFEMTMVVHSNLRAQTHGYQDK